MKRLWSWLLEPRPSDRRTRAGTASSVALFLAAALACGANAPQPVQLSSLFPHGGDSERADPGRQDPWQHLADFEASYRVGGATEPYTNFPEDGYEDLAAFVYPTWTRPDAAFGYVLIGRDFAAVKNWGGAARAYWAALTLASRTVASRPDRENTRAAAFVGLAQVAEARGQKQWRELLLLCSKLGRTYLESDQRHEDHNAFYEVMTQIEATQRQGEQAAEEAHDANQWAQLQAGLGALQGGIAVQEGFTQQGFDMQLDALRTSMTASSAYNQQLTAIQDALGSHAGEASEFRAVVADDVSEVEAGNSFVANEAIFMLATAAAPSPYLEVLATFAEDKPALAAAVAAFDPEAKEDSIKAIALNLRNEEIYVAKYERRGLAPPPRSEVPELQGPPPPAPPVREIAGRYTIVEAREPGGASSYTGAVTIEQAGEAFRVEYATDGVPPYYGVALQSGAWLAAGWSVRALAGVTVYVIGEDGKLDGTWTTVAAAGALGHERLEGPASLGGSYRVAAGTLPSGASYTGVVSIVPNRDTFSVVWDIAGERYRGVGIRREDRLVVGWAPGDEGAGVTLYLLGDDNLDELSAVWAAPGSRELGLEKLLRTSR